MDREIAKLWAAELRSGKYLQLQNEMGVHLDGPAGMRRSAYGRCCLGVLREVLLERDPSLASAADSTDMLSSEEVKAAGMKPLGGHLGEFEFYNGERLEFYGETCLSAVNDLTGAKFGDIAGFIDEHWERL
jgi:hypothetical protein